MTKYEKTFNKVEKIIREYSHIFTIPNGYENSDYNFQNYLKQLLDNYELFFNEKLNDIINDEIPFIDGEKDVILKKIYSLNRTIKKTIDLYFQGKPYEANKIFNLGLEKVYLKTIQYETEIAEGKNFYRARPDNSTFYKRKDLFHIDFKSRTLVSTNRYSIPGFPALYLGDSSYVCWEEFDKPKFKNLWFSRLQNKKKIKIIEVLLLDDFLNKVESISNKDLKFTHILRYFIYFPLTIASTIKVKNIKHNFKPEYIIPQMLLEYVISNPEIDGIRFPSTKIDYKLLKQVDSYNYVFPVKTNKDVGLCEKLISLFKLTNPTSLEVEELLNNPARPTTYLNETKKEPSKKIKIADEEHNYISTSFGKIEYILKKKKLKVL